MLQGPAEPQQTSDRPGTLRNEAAVVGAGTGAGMMGANQGANQVWLSTL